MEVPSLDGVGVGVPGLVAEEDPHLFEVRVVLEDVFGVEGLPAPGGIVHDADDHRFVDEGVGIPLEVEVRQGADEEIVLSRRTQHQAAAGVQLGEHLPLGESRDEHLRQPGRIHLHEDPLEGRRQGQIVSLQGQNLVQQGGADLRLPQDMGQAVAEVHHLHPVVPQQIREGVVFLLRLLHPQDVVEEQLVLVVDGETLQLLAGTVEHDPLQLADFRAHAKGTIRAHPTGLPEKNKLGHVMSSPKG